MRLLTEDAVTLLADLSKADGSMEFIIAVVTIVVSVKNLYQ